MKGGKSWREMWQRKLPGWFIKTMRWKWLLTEPMWFWMKEKGAGQEIGLLCSGGAWWRIQNSVRLQNRVLCQQTHFHCWKQRRNQRELERNVSCVGCPSVSMFVRNGGQTWGQTEKDSAAKQIHHIELSLLLKKDESLESCVLGVPEISRRERQWKFVLHFRNTDWTENARERERESEWRRKERKKPWTNLKADMSWRWATTAFMLRKHHLD